VGDSGEKDAQVYAQIANDYPDNIAKIFIRNVDGSDLAELYKLIFDGLPKSLWQVFDAAADIHLDLSQL